MKLNYKTNMNKLKFEKSSYLLQHANNPVNWYPWSEEAFKDSVKENKPILLSIGYSACHWCHVMAHESFENDETAKIMNDNFINIKLDKEERPDLDKIYQISQTIITGKSGGWPLTVFMTPDKFPFFAGTYFPPEEKFGLPSFKDILIRVLDFYKTGKKDIELQNTQLNTIFKNITETKNLKYIINEKLLEKVQKELLSSIDKVHGGFGSAPKFPNISNLDFLIKLSSKKNKSETQYIELTLNRMCVSGIFDHLKGGFFRYSVDELWMIPHFEKMLYDNGPMISLLCNGYKLLENDLYLDAINKTCDWLISEMQNEDGGFYSTIDADSENSEGKFYVWQEEELKNILNKKEYDIFKKVFVIYNRPNFENKYHLHVSKENENDYKKNSKLIKIISDKLLVQRSKRIKPSIDKKILVSWNSLAISGLIAAYKLTNNELYYKSAKKSYIFIKEKMWKNHTLCACYHDAPQFDGYLDDYAFLAKSCLDLLRINWNNNEYIFLVQLVDKVLNDFQDKKNGGFYFSSINQKDLIYRPKSFMDESLPSGNSIMTSVLLEMYELTGEKKYLEAMDNTFKAASDSIERSNVSHCSLYMSSNTSLTSKRVIIIKCDKNDSHSYKNEIYKMEGFRDCIYFLNCDENSPIESINIKKCFGKFTAYICENNVCSEPIKDFNSLQKRLLNE